MSIGPSLLWQEVALAWIALIKTYRRTKWSLEDFKDPKFNDSATILYSGLKKEPYF